MAWFGRGREHRSIFQGSYRRVGHKKCRAILHRPWIFAVTGKFLDEIGSLSGPGGFEAKEKHSRVVLACRSGKRHSVAPKHRAQSQLVLHRAPRADRKSTRLNSSHMSISYAVFCLKKKK